MRAMILVGGMMVFTGSASAQNSSRTAAPAADSLQRLDAPRIDFRTAPSQPIAAGALPAGAATAHWGFFCRQEARWDKALPVNLRLRAGQPADCDRLEGKRRD